MPLWAWPRWRPDAPVEAWLHRIALNAAHSHRRRQRLREVGEVVRRLGRPADPPDPAAQAERSVLVEALRRLPQALAAAVVLRHYHGYTNREIAVSLGVSERTVGSRLRQGLSRLQAQLGPDFSEISLPTSQALDVELVVKSEAADA